MYATVFASSTQKVDKSDFSYLPSSWIAIEPKRNLMDRQSTPSPFP